MSRYRLIVVTEALPGREDAYSAWSRDQHFPDIMRIPGVNGAERFRLQNADPDAPARFMAVFESDRQPADILAEMRRRNGTPEMPASPDHNREAMQVMFYESIGRWDAPPS